MHSFIYLMYSLLLFRIKNWFLNYDSLKIFLKFYINIIYYTESRKTHVFYLCFQLLYFTYNIVIVLYDIYIYIL